jgi:hypothetical protein
MRMLLFITFCLAAAMPCRASDDDRATVWMALTFGSTIANGVTVPGTALSWAERSPSTQGWAIASMVTGGIGVVSSLGFLLEGTLETESMTQAMTLIVVTPALLVSAGNVALGAVAYADAETWPAPEPRVGVAPVLVPSAGGSVGLGVGLTLFGF